MAADLENTLYMDIPFGRVVIAMRPDLAPNHVAQIKALARRGFYDGVPFHRVIDGFMVQGGDPTGTGAGGPGYQFEDEVNRHKVERGALAMANAGPNTNGSQFFIVTAAAAPWLDGKHTVFGRVSDGLDVLERLERTPADASDRPTRPIGIDSIELSD